MSWETITDSAGREHDICAQDSKNSCVAASIAMIRRIMTGRRPPEILGRWSIEVGSNLYAGKPSIAMRDWDNKGTYAEEFVLGLRQAGLRGTIFAPTTDFFTKFCTPKTPGLCGVLWDSGSGGHGIVCLGTLPKNDKKVVFLDPYYGIQEIDTSVLPIYNPRIMSSVFNGKFNANRVHCLVN
jgi:hypothetical protein